MISRTFLLFLVAGGVAALANFGSRIVFSQVFDYVPAIVLAYCVGMLTAFVLNRLFVFTATSNSVQNQAMWFVLVNIAAVLQTVVISVLLRNWLFPSTGMSFHPDEVAHAIGVVVPVVTSYLGHRHLTFKESAP